MTDDDRHREADDHSIRASLMSAGRRPTPEFVASLRDTLHDVAAGRTTATVAPPDRPSRRWWSLLAAAAVVALVATAVVVATRGGDGEVATAPPDSTAPPGDTADVRDVHPSTAEQLREWVGVRLNGVGNGAVDGQYPWFVIDSVVVATDEIRMHGDDGCNAWTANGTIVDGRFEFVDGEMTLQDCGPGGFSLRSGDGFIVRDDGVDVERGGITYPFGPDPVVEDAATLIDRRRFVETSGARPFPFSISFDGADVVGFDGCGDFEATAVYSDTAVQLVDVESQCTTTITPVDGDLVEHVGGNTIELRRDGASVVGSLVAASESSVRSTAEWMLGDWSMGWGLVTFGDGIATFGHCETTWQASEGIVVVDPWGECVTGLFPGDPRAEETLRVLVDAPLTQRLLPPNEISETAEILDSGRRSVRMVRVETAPPSTPGRLFALADVDGEPFEHGRLPTVVLLGTDRGILARGTDGCGEYSVTGTRSGTGIAVQDVSTSESCGVVLPPDLSFAPAPGATIAVDGSQLTATDTAGRTGRYLEVGALDEALVSDLLDPVSGTGIWGVDGLTVELTGPPGVGVLRVGTCEADWSFGLDDDPTTGLGPLTIDSTPQDVFGCVDADRGHDAAGLLALLASTTSGDGAEVRLAADGDVYLVWDVRVVRLHPAGSADQELLDALVGRPWFGVDGPWRTPSPTLLFDSLNREPGLLGVAIDTGCNHGQGTFRLDGDRMTATQITVEEAGCDHEVAHLTEGTTLSVDGDILTVTSTDGGERITTTYVARDSLRAVASPDLSGEWLANGTPISVDGTVVVAGAGAPSAVVAVVRGAFVEGTTFTLRRGAGWILAGAGGVVQLDPAP